MTSYATNNQSTNPEVRETLCSLALIFSKKELTKAKLAEKLADITIYIPEGENDGY
jgi:hypothetical protein